jgi:hypothetical protein
MTRPITLTSSVNHTAVIPAAITTQRLTTVSNTATIVVLLPVFTIPPTPSVRCWLFTEDVPYAPLELTCEQLQLTRRRVEPLRVVHHPAAVEQYEQAVFTIEQRIDLFVETMKVSTERLSKCHDLQLRRRDPRWIRRLHA